MPTPWVFSMTNIHRHTPATPRVRIRVGVRVRVKVWVKVRVRAKVVGRVRGIGRIALGSYGTKHPRNGQRNLPTFDCVDVWYRITS